MRELTIKEKAKAYDEAVERATKLYENANGMILKKWVEQVFPALAESGDEENIKKLIDELQCILRGAKCQNEACNGGQEKRIALLEWAIAWLEKQGEQKPWRKDDEYYFNAIISVIKKNQSLLRLEDWDINWLESIKDRVQVQPQQEWREEDIVAINCAVEALSKDLPSLAASIRRLKQISPQYAWKPSGQQMASIKQAVTNMKNSACYDSELVSLFNDLKKLMEV